MYMYVLCCVHPRNHIRNLPTLRIETNATREYVSRTKGDASSVAYYGTHSSCFCFLSLCLYRLPLILLRERSDGATYSWRLCSFRGLSNFCCEIVMRGCMTGTVLRSLVIVHIVFFIITTNVCHSINMLHILLHLKILHLAQCSHRPCIKTNKHLRSIRPTPTCMRVCWLHWLPCKPNQLHTDCACENSRMIQCNFSKRSTQSTKTFYSARRLAAQPTRSRKKTTRNRSQLNKNRNGIHSYGIWGWRWGVSDWQRRSISLRLLVDYK